MPITCERARNTADLHFRSFCNLQGDLLWRCRVVFLAMLYRPGRLAPRLLP
jgi:hypothetical protein